MRVAGSAGETGEALREPSDAVGEFRAPRYGMDRSRPFADIRPSYESNPCNAGLPEIIYVPLAARGVRQRDDKAMCVCSL